MTRDASHALTKGRIALALAMAREGHSIADAARETKSHVGAINNVLSGARNVGVDLGMRIQQRYGVPIESFRMPAPEGAVMPEYTRRRAHPPSEAA